MPKPNNFDMQLGKSMTPVVGLLTFQSVEKEVIELCHHEARNVPCAGLVDGASKQPVVGRALYEIVE